MSFGNNVVLDALLLTEGYETVLPELKLQLGEADARIALHVYLAAKSEATRVVVLLNDVDVMIVYFIDSYHIFTSVWLRELPVWFWNRRTDWIHSIARLTS